MVAEIIRYPLWRRRVRAVHAWRGVERAVHQTEHGAYVAAIQRIVDQGATVPDPAGRRPECAE
ncbi:hypothetical protein [Actinoplanes derwentensis]|uniref:Uncharacterized protein n=1 Tax=Actinoplanes derwentensis TaxID=113562 RepID=A0A1H1ZN19_9ACTN|nr:hypothetical protein [Actinoplanes derwentensis]GID82524.1 hypothetical protein Ade03nite_14480 [Actinoplanes derwentensis]SDT35043.1 hypothetical protein SAMN04489716_3404 [Actinoplanes derwentensis]